jgi:predicted DNA-binding protein (MmcQ/YjbR family)
MNRLTIRPARLRRLREICLSLPGAREKETWGDPTWRVRDRIFHEGGRPSLWLKMPKGAQRELVASRPGRFFVPPYVGHKGWVGIHLDGPRVDWAGIGALVAESFRLIAPRGIRARRVLATRVRARHGR